MVPMTLPDLPKPSRTLGKSQKPLVSKPDKIQKNSEKKSLYSLLTLFWGDPPLGDGPRSVLTLGAGAIGTGKCSLSDTSRTTTLSTSTSPGAMAGRTLSGGPVPGCHLPGVSPLNAVWHRDSH